MSELEKLPKLKTSEECETMVDVRHEVDRLDRVLVELLAQRQTYMSAAARIKPNREMVYDEARIEDVVQKVLVSSGIVGLSPKIAEPVWRTLIAECIEYEYSAYDKNHK